MSNRSISCDNLPVAESLPQIMAAVAKSIPVVLQAPPGAGKTTAVPPALLRSGVVGGSKVLLVQPRRFAARNAARRLAWITETTLGEEVGYHVRFDNRTSASTRLIAMTTGVLLRRLQADPLLEDVSCVILDEFHERSLDIDLALGMLQRVRTTFRPELKLVVMSATLEPQPIVDFLGDACAVTSHGRSFPVEVRHANTFSNDSVDRQVAAVLPEVWKATAGHVLVFLPGVGEIRRTRRAIEPLRLEGGRALFELYGDMAPDAQDAVLGDSPTRKIILATNVAETSITIPGVTGVIDSGLARVLHFDPSVGLPKLELGPISQASAEQRAGRAGRTQAGLCFRLWPAVAHRSRRRVDIPEILRGDFSEACLTLTGWGERDVFAFPWLTPPRSEAVDAARGLLSRLGATDPQGRLTDLGRRMLALPLHPRLSRFMVEADRLGVTEDASLAAALLTERDPTRGQANASSGPASDCDLSDRVELLKRHFAGDRSAVEHPAAAKQVRRVAEQILRTVGSRSQPDVAAEGSARDRFKRALLAAYPDRLARRRRPGGQAGLMVGGRGVRLAATSAARTGDLFLCLDVDDKGTEALVRAATVIEEDWLPDSLLREVDEPFFHPSAQAVVARRRKYFDDLMLRESPIACTPGPEVAALLFRHARQNLSAVFPEQDQEISRLIARIRFLTDAMPEADLPSLDPAAIDDVLEQLCGHRTSYAELRAAPWLDHLRSRYDYQQLQWIDQHAPSRIQVPSGNWIAVEYSSSSSPVMRVRLQELFGWEQTPRVAGKRVPVQLHLLGPNYRPQQITEDLANFWRSTYVDVRKELKRRYPKHHWPDDPSRAKATRNGLKPRSSQS